MRGSLNASDSLNFETIAQLWRMKSVFIGGQKVVALFNTGFTTTMVQMHLVRDWKERSDIMVFDGRKVKCRGKMNIMLELEGC